MDPPARRPPATAYLERARVLVEAFDRWPNDPELRAWMEGMDLQGEVRPGNSGSSK